MELLQCIHLEKSYGNKKILQDVNLTIPRGKIIGLLGKNGTGKTTLIKLLNDLLTISSGEILINGKPVDALSQLAYRPSAQVKARKVCEALKGEIARQQFKIAIQGAIGSTIIARETVQPVRKDVLAKCYGGDITRKRKLLEKQKEGKKRMKMVGDVELPQNAFLAVLRTKDDD